MVIFIQIEGWAMAFVRTGLIIIALLLTWTVIRLPLAQVFVSAAAAAR